jgi:hypothetical protein
MVRNSLLYGNRWQPTHSRNRLKGNALDCGLDTAATSPPPFVKRAFFRCYSTCRESFWLKLTAGIIVASGPLFIGWARLAPKDGEPQTWVFSKNIALFFEHHPYLAVLAFTLPAAAVGAKVIFERLDRKSKLFKAITDEGLVELLDQLQEVVAIKMEHTGEAAAAKLRGVQLDAFNRAIFEQCDKSEQVEQMRAIIDAAYKIFRLMTKESGCKVKVSLARVENRTFGDWVCFLPMGDGPVAPPEILRHSNSTFTACVHSKSPVLVEDVRPETQKHLKGMRSRFSSEAEIDGSSLSFPIRHRNLGQIVFVLSIFCTKKGALRKIEQDKYSYVLEQFAKRLLVEYNLLVQNNADRILTGRGV